MFRGRSKRVRSQQRTLTWSLAALCGCAPTTLPPSAPSVLIGEPIPEFSRRALSGQSVTTDELRGRIVVVEFFARYCEPCWKHLPRLQRWARANPDVQVIGLGGDEYASDTEAMVRALDVRFPVVHDAGLALTARFRVDKIPSTLVIDRAGTVRWRSFPGDGLGEVDRAVKALRAGLE